MLGDAIANFEENLEVFHRAEEVPVRLNHVGRVVIVVGDVVRALQFTEASRFAGVVDSRARFQ